MWESPPGPEAVPKRPEPGWKPSGSPAVAGGAARRPAGSSGLRALGILCSPRLPGARLPAAEVGAACSAPKVGALGGSCRGAHASCPLPAAPGAERGAGSGTGRGGAGTAVAPAGARSRLQLLPGTAGLLGPTGCAEGSGGSQAWCSPGCIWRGAGRGWNWDSEEASRGAQRAVLPAWLSVTQPSWDRVSPSGPREIRDDLASQPCTRGLMEAFNSPMPPFECLNVKPPRGEFPLPSPSSPRQPAVSVRGPAGNTCPSRPFQRRLLCA